MKNTLRSSNKCKQTKRRHKTLEINLFAIYLYTRVEPSVLHEYIAFFVLASSENDIPKTYNVNTVATKVFYINMCEILTILIANSEADAAKSDSDGHARPKRVQTRFKLGHKVIMHHPYNQRSIKRTARMSSASPTMYGTKSTRKEYLKANKNKRQLPAKLKKWPHY